MKKSISVLLIAILMITLAACGDGMQDGQDGIYRKFHAMQNYMAEVEVTVYGNKGNTIYTMRQFYEDGGESLSVVYHSFVINHKDFNADFSVE